MRLQIGMDTYKFDTQKEQLAAIRSVVIYHQGQLNTMKFIAEPTHRVFYNPIGSDDYTEFIMDGSEKECEECASCTPNAFVTTI